MKLSVVILTKNEERNILDCIESLSFADEIIIVDDKSEDRTHEVIENLENSKIRFYENKLDHNFSKQRNFGLSKAKGEWVLFVDADERVSKDLAREIEESINQENFFGFYIKRVDIMWGRKLSYGEVGNIKFLRLAKKDNSNWKGRVHEVLEVNGKVGNLKQELIHYPHPTLSEFLAEINFYSTIRASELHDKKVKVTALDIILYPKAKFVLNYFIKLGFLDGIEGFVFAAMMSFHSYLVRGKLWLLTQK